MNSFCHIHPATPEALGLQKKNLTAEQPGGPQQRQLSSKPPRQVHSPCAEPTGAIEHLAISLLIHLTSGFRMPCQLHQVIVARFADDDLIIDFDNFVRCLIRLETLFSKCPLGEKTHFSSLGRKAAYFSSWVKQPEPETSLFSWE